MAVRAEYDREKLCASMMLALRKRPVTTEAVDMAMDRIEERCSPMGVREIATDRLGELVMRELKKLDKIGYIRFASVYRNFEDVDEFSRCARSTKPTRRRARPEADDRGIRWAADHASWRARCRLAARGLWTTSPNPRVGCVIVRDGGSSARAGMRRPASRTPRSTPAGRRRAGAWRNRLCDAGTLQPPRPHAALRRRADRRRRFHASWRRCPIPIRWWPDRGWHDCPRPASQRALRCA
jgi:hypothetical protein